MCFSVQKLCKRFSAAEHAAHIEESTVSVEAVDAVSPPRAPTSVSSASRSFRSRVRAIQNAQRFIYGNPKLRSTHPSYGSKDSSTKNTLDSTLSLLHVQAGSAYSAPDLGPSSFDVDAAYRPPQIDQTSANGHSPRPLPSPRSALRPPNAYRLPLPSESANTASLHPSLPQLLSPRINMHMPNIAVLPSASSASKFSVSQSSLHTTTSSTSIVPCIHVYNGINPLFSCTTTSSIHASQVQTGNNPGLSSIQPHDLIVSMKDSEPELQPLPSPKVLVTASALRHFRYDELASACQNFSPNCCFDSADACFYGAIKVKVNEKVSKHQDVVVVRPKETQHQGLQDWMSKLLMLAHELHEEPHVCKLVGFYGEDGCIEHMLVYERLKKGSLCTILFEGLDAPHLDWSMRMKIAYGAAQGLASLHERFPDKVLYKDFRASSIQVDGDHNAKISGYRPVDTSSAETHTTENNPRAHAYRAPETLSRGELTLKSNVWSFGVILLELLSGLQNMDERTTKDERHNLVKWAKPFLIDEGKLFLLMDPKLHGKFPFRGAKMVADLVMLCLNRDPTKRPTMREALDRVKSVHELQYTTRSSTKESTSTHKVSSSSSTLLPSLGDFSVKPILKDDQRSSYHRLPTKFSIIESPPLRPLLIPPRCSDDAAHDYTPAPLAHVKY